MASTASHGVFCRGSRVNVKHKERFRMLEHFCNSSSGSSQREK